LVSTQGEDYLLFAEAKGLRGRTIFLRYAIRNALLPQLTALALALGNIISGAVLVEVIFQYPGVGSLLYQSIRASDFFMIQGVVFIIIVAIGLATLILDLIYPVLDPVLDIGLTIPGLMVLVTLAMNVKGGLSIPQMILVVAALAWLFPARVIRAQVLSARERAYIDVARLSGTPMWAIIVTEVLPNLMPYIVASLVGSVSAAVLASVGLEYSDSARSTR
jgi:ABC-type dipeptide/oligopeptide/nickel transport system permease component